MTTAFDRTEPWHQADLADGSRYLAYAPSPTHLSKDLPVEVYGPMGPSPLAKTTGAITPDGDLLLDDRRIGPVSSSGDILIACGGLIRVGRSLYACDEDQINLASRHDLDRMAGSMTDDDPEDRSDDDLLEARENTLGDSYCRL